MTVSRDNIKLDCSYCRFIRMVEQQNLGPLWQQRNNVLSFQIVHAYEVSQVRIAATDTLHSKVSFNLNTLVARRRMIVRCIEPPKMLKAQSSCAKENKSCLL